MLAAMAVEGRKAPAIAFGAHEAFGKPSGIGRYQSELVKRLAPRTDLHLIVHQPFSEIAVGPGAPPVLKQATLHYPGAREAMRQNALTIAGRLLTHPYLFDANRQAMRMKVATRLAEGAYADRHRFDLYHSTGSYMPITKRVRARVVTVHDVTPLTMPERHAPETVKGFLRRSELREDDHVVVGSAASGRDFLKAFPHAEERVHVIYYGVNHEIFFPGPARTEGPPYIVSVGMIEPRKNLVRALAAFEQVAVGFPTIRWKVVGRKGWGWAQFEAALAASPVKDRVDIMGPVDDAALAALYRGARALFFPSLWEGLGIPVLEAMAAGTPVAASRIPPLVDAGEGVVELADPQDVGALAEALYKAAVDVEGREARIRAGIERASTYSWDIAASQHLELYAKLLGCSVGDLARPGGLSP